MKTPVVFCIALFVAACAVQDAAPPLTAEHPASPHATSAPEPAPTDTLVPSARPGLSGDSAAAEGARGMRGTPDTYTCPMHPEIRAAKPGRCPKCGMDLVPLDSAASGPEKSHAH